MVLDKRISENLREARFILMKHNTKIPAVKKGEDWNEKTIDYDTANEKLKEGFNIGLVCGLNDFFAIDCDGERAVELSQACEEFIPSSYVETTTSGGFHHIFKNRNKMENLIIKDGKHNFGEVRCNRQSIVIAPSIAKNKKGELKSYEVLNDREVNYVSKEEVKKVLLKFMSITPKTETKIQLSEEVLKKINNDVDLNELFNKEVPEGQRSETEQSLANKLRSRNFDKETSFKILYNSKIGKLKEKPLSYWTLMWDKACSYVTTEKSEYKERPIHTENLDLRTYSDYKKLKKNKNYIVEDFLIPKTLNMIVSPPAQFKSLLSVGLGFSISNGKNFLKLKTKKSPVLYLDGENSDSLLKERYEQIHEGMNLKRNKFPFYILKNGLLMDEKKNINLGFLIALERIIEDNKIKLIIFDTMHRFAYYDENKSDDINILYTKVFRPLIEDYGVTILFLHHTTKDGSYRGSGDFLGMVDTYYRVIRTKDTNKFRIENLKCRSGEIPNINGEIDFGEGYIRFIRHSEKVEEEKTINKLKETTNKIRSMFKDGLELKRKEIIEDLNLQQVEYGNIRTIDRSLKYLVEESEFLIKSEKGVYSKILN